MLTGSNTADLGEPASLALSLLHHCTTTLVMFGVPSRQLDFLNFVVELRAIAVLLERTNEALMAGHVSLQVATKRAMSSKLGKLRRRSVMYRLNYAASAASDRAGNDESDSDTAV
jgi:hypothetical protein